MEFKAKPLLLYKFSIAVEVFIFCMVTFVHEAFMSASFCLLISFEESTVLRCSFGFIHCIITSAHLLLLTHAVVTSQPPVLTENLKS